MLINAITLCQINPKDNDPKFSCEIDLSHRFLINIQQMHQYDTKCCILDSGKNFLSPTKLQFL